MSVLPFVLFSSISYTSAFQRLFLGDEKTKSLELINEGNTGIKMEMTYWTTLKETKECVLDPYDCNLDEYDTYFEGDLKLKNVDTNGWSNDGSDNIQIYLAFDQRSVSDVEVYDILTFQYTWDSTKIKEVGRWSCVDGNIPLNL